MSGFSAVLAGNVVDHVVENVVEPLEGEIRWI